MRSTKKSLISISLFVLLVFVVGGGYLIAFPTIPNPGYSNTDTVTWDVRLNNPFIMQGSDGEILLNLLVKGQEVKSVKRAPLNLVLVIDRSGSMNERGKIEYAKAAAKRIISRLNSHDRLAIVAYSTDVQLVYPIGFLKDKETAISVVDSLYPSNSTNLSAGLTTGIAQLKAIKRDGYINRVILLSDGLANVGITDVERLGNIASQAAENSIHITTMGLGINYDEDIMMNIAEYGAGNYYFIESPTQLAGIFEKEFGQITASIAKDSKIYLSLAPGVHLKDVYGYSYKKKNGKYEVNLGDLYSGQRPDIVIKLDAPTKKPGRHELAKASLVFTDILKNNQTVYFEQDLSYEITRDKNRVDNNEDRDVSARGISVYAAGELHTASTEYEKGNRADALQLVKKALGRIADLNKSSQRSEATIEQEEVLRKAIDDMSDAAAAPSTPVGKKLIKEYKAMSREQQK